MLRWLLPGGVAKEDRLVLGVATGLGLMIYSTAALGGLGLLTPTWVAACLVMLTIPAALQLPRMIRDFSRTNRTKGETGNRWADGGPLPRWLLTALLVSFGLIFLFSGLTPPIDGDTLHSYLHVPRQFLDVGRILQLPFEVHANVPLNVQMLSAMALSLVGDELAQLLASFTMLTGSCAVLIVLGRRYLSLEAGLLAALLFASMNCVQALIPSAKVNLGWAFFELASFYCFARWWLDEPKSDCWLACAGILQGLALGTLYAAVSTVSVISICLCWGSRADGLNKTVKRLFVYLAPAVLLASPWLIRNVMETGNPVYPVLNPLFGLPYGMPIRHNSGFWGIAVIWWEMSIGHLAGHFGKPVGPWVIVPLTGLVFVRPIPRFLRLALIISIPLFIIWNFGVQRPRNFLSGLGLFSLASSWILIRLSTEHVWPRRILRVSLLVFLLFNLAVMIRASLAQPGHLDYLVGLMSRDGIERMVQNRHLASPNALMTRYINDQLPDGARVLAINLGNGYYIKHPFWDSRMADGDFYHDKVKNHWELINIWKRMGITHVFINRPYLNKNLSTEDTSVRLALDVLDKPEYANKCFRLLLKSDGQEIWELKCR